MKLLSSKNSFKKKKKKKKNPKWLCRANEFFVKQ